MAEAANEPDDPDRDSKTSRIKKGISLLIEET